MSKKEKPLPIPPNSPIGRKKGFMQNEEEEPLMADQIAKAIAEGKLEEFLQNKMPDNEYAKALTMMMLKMTGMSPSEGLPSEIEEKSEKPSNLSGEMDTSQETTSTAKPLKEFLNALNNGDTKGLMELLEKDTIDQLIKISSDNKVTLDWIVLRALRVYVQEYLKTGRL